MRSFFATPLALAVGIALSLASPAAMAQDQATESSTPATADASQQAEAPEIAELRAELRAQMAQIAELKRRLEELAQQTSEARDSARRADETAATAATAAQTATDGYNALTNARSVSHLAGYGFVNFTAPKDGDVAFSTASFNPIFHWYLDDKILFEGELEIEVEDGGESEFNLEYATIDWLFSDYGALVAGRFLSPLGYFRQNLHPAWINRFASAPVGFGHDGAAPIADLGAQIRGGWTTTALGRFNYAAYVANGPELEAEEDELEGVNSNGAVRNEDGNLVVGGRIGWLPVPEIEIGFSFADGRTSITEVEGEEVEGEPDRDYRFYGGDLAWHPLPGLELRGEYARQRAGGAESSLAPDSAIWRAWYAQAAYRVPNTSWEVVGRYGDFEATSNEMMSLSQVGVGLNYWLTQSTVIKAAYEFNDPDRSMSPMQDRFLLQIAHGF